MVDRQHLEEQLAKDYKLLKKLEDKLRLEDDPKRQAKLELDIEELEEQIQQRESQKTLAAQSYQDSQQNIDELVQQVRTHCCEKIQDLYSKIRLLNFRQVDVDQLYVEVHILERPSNKVYVKITDWLRERNPYHAFDRFGLGERYEERLPGLEVAMNFSKLMVLGKPGAGKSTFLRYLAIACRKGEFLPNHIPVLIELRSIQNVNQFNFLEIIHQEFELIDNIRQTQQILKSGKVLLLLDGFDEVSNQVRETIRFQIMSFVQKYRKTRVIITCRTQTVEYTLPNFEYVEVADFNPEQVAIFARNWFTAITDTSEQGTALGSQFMTVLKLPEHKRTAELAVTPILLSLTCWVFQDTGSLPARRTELYQQGIDLLLEKWDGLRGIERVVGSEQYQLLDIEQRQALLSHVSVRKYEQKQFVLFGQQEIQRYIADYFMQSGQVISERDSRDILKAIEAQHGLLIERASQVYSFSHLTFQEFFAAKWFSNSSNQQDLIHRNLIRYLIEKQGQELIRFALDTSGYADSFAESLKQAVDELLAPDNQLQQFLTWVQQKTCSMNISGYPNAVRALYFALALDPTLELNISLALDLKLHSALAPIFGLSPERALEKIFELVHSHTAVRELAFDLALIFTVTYTLTYDAHSSSKLAFELDRVHSCILDTKLQNTLQTLIQQLPNIESNWKHAEQWWIDNNQTWVSQFRTILIEHRNIGHEWHFDQNQRALLQKYYIANRRLIIFLRSSQEVSSAVRQKIEEALLLPIAEIEKRKNRLTS